MSAVVACDPAKLERDSFSMITETISGIYCPATKATIADTDASFKWSVGDNIAVHVSNGDSHKYVFTSGEGGASQAAASASFSVTYDSGYSRDAFAVYPSTIVAANASNYGQSGHTLDVTLPPDYTLAQVQGEVSPCPMVATNSASSFSWDFYQLCSLLRITVSNIPANAKRLEIDFDGKKVWGDFSIASGIVPGTSTSVIATATDANHDTISITKDGSDDVLGEASLILNIPLPVGDYSKIIVNAYDAVSGGNVISFDNISFGYTAAITKGVKKSSALTDQSIFTFTFRDADTQTNLGGLRFVRLFSCQNKLYNGATTFGPYTVSSDTGEADRANPVQATLKFGPDDGDQLAFQVIDANGKVYSGLYNAPAGGFTMGEYDLTVDVKAYTFTLDGKKVYFSPGDLGVDNSVYSFTEPFASWNDSSKDQAPSKRTWFNYTEVNHTSIEGDSGHSIYGVKWRNTTGKKIGTNSFSYELDYLINRTIDEGRVATYYHVTIGSNNCLLLPPDEAVEDDLDGLTDGAAITNYHKYLAKGFVLLWNKGRRTDTAQKRTWGGANQGWYWAICDNGTNRRYFYWETNTKPKIDWAGSQYRMRVRYVRDVE